MCIVMNKTELFKKCYEKCINKVKLHMANTTADLCDLLESDDGNYYNKLGFPLKVRWNWLSSMAVGMPAILSVTEHDRSYLEWMEQFSGEYDKKVSGYCTQTMHDLGFLYLPYSVQLYRLTSNEKHKKTALKAADELAKRFNVTGRFIEAWDEMNIEQTEGRMIIDSLMNIPLLFWAWKETGHIFYRDVAKAHADTALKVLIRDDFSVKHAVFFNQDGTVKEEANNCGYANGSHWARGTAWAIFGFISAAAYTGEKRYLHTAVKLFDKYYDCLKEADKIPVWDFRLPADKPAYKCGSSQDESIGWDEALAENKKYNRDSSAAAIVGVALVELYKHTNNKKYYDFAEKTLKTLCESYFNYSDSREGMLQKSNGRNTYTIYGDYFFLLLLTEILYKDTSFNCWF